MRIPSVMLLLVAGTLLVSCESGQDRAVYDGYTLRGLVIDEATGDPIIGAQVLAGWETSIQLQPHSKTDAEGRFKYLGFPGTAPSREVFRFEMNGYETKDVSAKNAQRVADFNYYLEVSLQKSPTL